MVGGQQSLTEHIENYPGTGKDPISGIALAEQMQAQAEAQGAEFLFDEVKGVEVKDSLKVVKTAYSGDIEANAIILATGRSPRKLQVKGEDLFIGKGVSFCATCDGAFYRDKKIAIVGGGNAAFEEAIFLTKFASEIFLIHRRNEFRAEKVMIERVKSNPKIKIMTPYVITAIEGDKTVEKIMIKNNDDDKEQGIKVSGVFVYVGSDPNTQLFKSLVTTDQQNYVVVDDKMRTIVPGIFAAGDMLNKHVWQVVTAVSDGAIAAISAEEYLCDLQAKCLKENS
jgi:thioredoxin reductase (NADPH)